MVTIFGNNGIITKGIKSREENSHEQIKDEIQLEVNNYGMEVHLEISDLTLIDHLGKEGYFKDYDSNNKKDSYIINIERFKDSRLGKGKDKSTGDVYVVEKENEQSDIVVLRYYKTSTEVEDLLKLNGE